MRRGEIYYIYITNPTGCEIAKGRPGIIVSNNSLNAVSEVVEVVYLTTQPKEDRATHVSIRSSDRPSTALCEQVNTVSKTRVGTYCGTCTEEEMAAIDAALLISLGIDLAPKQEPKQEEPTKMQVPTDVMANYIKAVTERDIYKELYERLIEKAVL